MTHAALLLALAAALGSHGRSLPSEADTLSLGQAVRQALQSHPNQAAAQARVEEAQATLEQARGGRRPSLNLQGGAIRHELPMVVAPLHAFDPSSPPRFDELLIQGRAQASWTLLDWGSGSSSVDAGGARLSASRELASVAALDLTQKTATTYLTVAALRVEVGAHEARLQALSGELDRVERFLAEGSAASVERFRAMAELERAGAAMSTAQAELEAAEAALARLVGMSPQAVRSLHVPIPPLESPLEQLFPGAADGAGVMVSARPAPLPELEVAQYGVDAAEHESRIARVNRLPRLQLVAGLNHFAGNDTRGMTEWDVGVRLAWPLFTGGVHSGALAAAKARERGARHNLRAAELSQAESVDQAQAALRGAQAQHRALSAAMQLLQEVIRIETLALEEGSGTQRDFLQAHADAVEVQWELARAGARIVAARIALARAEGRLEVNS